MQCAKVQALLPFYSRADLSREVARALTEHLLACAVCRSELSAIQAENSVLQAHVAVAPDGDVLAAKVAIAARLGLSVADTDLQRVTNKGSKEQGNKYM